MTRCIQKAKAPFGVVKKMSVTGVIADRTENTVIDIIDSMTRTC